MVKAVFRTALTIYLLVLLWLVLFKFSTDIVSVLSQHPASGLNIIPFAHYWDHWGEIRDNFIVFIPFGLLLSVNFKRIALWQKLLYIFTFSCIVETTQFVLTIGVADITDIIANTLGGLFGLLLYSIGQKYIDVKQQDRFIIATGALLLAVLLVLRFFVLKVRY